MDDHDFTTLLRSFMARAVRSNRDLAQLTGIAIRTIEGWTAGEMRRPRYVADVLKVARALQLDAADTTALLHVGGHPPLDALQTQAGQTGDPQLTALLVSWEPSVPLPAAALPATGLPLRHQLRAPVADFVGRAGEITELVAALTTALADGYGTIISGVQGMGGIGKTELAFAVAHQLRGAFPNAQIVQPLYGSSPTPLTAVQALQAVIRAFTPEARLPEDLPALEQHYRSLLHGQRALILADDAADAAQVRPLIPPSGCVLLITSRQRFVLPGMRTVQLEQLDEAEAVALLRRLAPRLDAEEAWALAHSCGYLPLALRVCGSILHTTAALPVADYLAGLADERRRLDQLRDPDDPQLDVAAALAQSYARLDAAAQSVFRQLGVLVADFAIDLARAVVAAPDVDVTAMLHHLLRRNLVMYDAGRDRWRLHDLVRDLARRELERAEKWVPTMWRYARATMQIAQEVERQYKVGGDNALAALTRFDTERPHIDVARRWVAEQAGTPEGDQLLLNAVTTMLYIGLLRYDARSERIPLWERARSAAQCLNDQHAERRALNNLGLAYADVGETRKAIGYYQQALIIACEIGDREGEGNALCNLGNAYHSLGEARRAISCYEQYLTIAYTLQDQRAQALALGNLGGSYAELGDFERAIPYFQQSLSITRAVGNRHGEGLALANLGSAYIDQGEPGRAIEFCEQAISIARAIGDRRLESHAVSYLARALVGQRDVECATTAIEQALLLFRAREDRAGEAECQWLVGLAFARHGERERALPLLHAAVTYEQEIGHAKAAEHAALVARLEAGKELPAELLRPAGQRAVGEDENISADADAQP
jgi:tetratricopeptide (TPR) repeat protein